MPTTRGFITVVPPSGLTVSVTITTAAGTAVTSYTAESGSSSHASPKSLSAATDFHLPTTGLYRVVTTYNGVTIDDVTVPVSSYGAGPTVVSPDIDTTTERASSSGTIVTLPVGSYVGPSAPAVTTRVHGTNAAYASPIVLGRQTSFDRIGVEVTGAATAATVLSIGIYSDSNGLPGALLYDCGTVLVDAVAWVEATVSITLPAGVYWFATALLTAPGTPPTVRAHSGAIAPAASATALTASQTALPGYSKSSVSGSLPASFSSPAATGSTSRVLARVA